MGITRLVVGDASGPFVGRPRSLRPRRCRGAQAPQLPVRDAEQVGHFAKRQAGADEVRYRLSLGAPSFGLGAPPGRCGLGEPGHGPGEQTHRGGACCKALLRDRRLLGSQFTQPSCGGVVAAACSGVERAFVSRG